MKNGVVKNHRIPETGFYYLNSRYYDSKTGRFINADDANIAIIGSITNDNANLYAYCNNNPVKNNDNTGYWVSVDSIILDSITAVTRRLTRRSIVLSAVRLRKAITNYFYNKRVGKKYINSGRFIYGQESNKTVSILKFGFAKFKNVGCEIIAIYNALCMKKKKSNIAKIALELELNGGQMGLGYLGCNPKYIASYLKAHKIKYTKYTTKNAFKNSLASGNVYILSAWNSDYGNASIKTYTSGLHTFMVKYTSFRNFQVCNLYNDDKGYTYYSFDSLMKGTKFSMAYKLK